MRRRLHDAALSVLCGCGCVTCAGAMAFLAEPDVAERDAAGGLGDMPYPPEYPKMEGEPLRVQPSRAKKTS